MRKIRNVLDALEGDDQNDRRFRVGVYAVCGVLFLLPIWIVAELVLR